MLDKKTDLISAPHALVYFGIVIFLVYFKVSVSGNFHFLNRLKSNLIVFFFISPQQQLSSILLGIHDPFVPFENLFCALFLGGIWDSLSKLLGRGQVKEETKDGAKKLN